MSDSFFIGKCCIVDLREIAVAQANYFKDHEYRIILKSGVIVPIAPAEDWRNLLVEYQKWIEKRVTLKGEEE